MADQLKDQGVRDSDSEEIRSRAVNEDVDEFEEVGDDEDEEDLDDEESSTF
jgi:hypothetical protein